VAKPVDADAIALVVARAIERRRSRARDEEASLREDLIGDEASDPAALAFRSAVEAARHEASRRYLLKLMRTFHGNVTRAAAQAGMTRESLHRVLRKYGVRSDDHKMAV
jgi:DNA-binding NtrC family response regulator